jgi:hypothetical protein
MSGSKPKVTVTGVGILSKFVIMHYFPEGYGIGLRNVPADKRPLDPQKGIEIAPNLRIRLASKEDVDFLSRYSTSTDSPIQYSLQEYVLECSEDTEDNPEARTEASHRIRRTINNTITALRLLKHGHIEANVILWITTRATEKDEYIMAERPGYAFSWDRYQLRTDELPQLIEMVKKTSDIDFEKRRSFRIALDRFNKSFYDTENEDRLIDYIISFEALFLEGENRPQHAVIPVACAMLLGNSKEERQEIRDLLDFAYEIRNHIVHGSHYEEKLAKNNLELEELVEKVEDLLRVSIKKLI